MATDKQVSFYKSLLIDTVNIYNKIAAIDTTKPVKSTQDAEAEINAQVVAFQRFSTGYASDLIGVALAAKNAMQNNLSKTEATQPQRVTSDVPASGATYYKVGEGMYKFEGDIYKVQEAKYGSGRCYAKKLTQMGDKWRFEYAQGAIAQLKIEHKLSIEDAKAFGALYGVCAVCGRILTDERSIELGIGPICAEKF